MVENPIYPPYQGTPTIGRVVVYVPEEPDFVEEGALMMAYNKEAGKRGIIVAIGQDTPLMPMDELIQVGMQVKIPEHPGLKDTDNGNDFYIFHHTDIFVTFPNCKKGVEYNG